MTSSPNPLSHGHHPDEPQEGRREQRPSRKDCQADDVDRFVRRFVQVLIAHAEDELRAKRRSEPEGDGSSHDCDESKT
jgi:hypothetical protein